MKAVMLAPTWFKAKKIRDFDALSDLLALIELAAAEGPSRSQALPHLHAIATSRVCIDRQRPRENEYFYKQSGTISISNGLWLSHTLRRTHSTFDNCPKQNRSACMSGVEPCDFLQRAGAVIQPVDFTNEQRRVWARRARSWGMMGDGGEVMQDDKLMLSRAGAYVDGHCGKTTDGQSGDCAVGDFGSLKLNHFVFRTWQTVTAECTRRCHACSQCKFVSISRKYKDCSWYAACDLHGTKRLGDFRSMAVQPANVQQQLPREWKPLNLSSASLPNAMLREVLINATRSYFDANPHYVVRRRLHPYKDSLLRWGETQGDVDPNRFHCPARFDLPGVNHWSCSERRPPLMGAFAPDAGSEWSEVVPAAPPFKYCKAFLTSTRVEPPHLRVPQVAIYLGERHAQVNIGHQAKDLMFAAHVLAMQRALRGTPQAFEVSTLLVQDDAISTNSMLAKPTFLYRNASLHILVEGAEPSIPITYLNQNAHWPEATQRSPNGSFHKNPAWGRARSVCFDVILQKGLIYAGDWRGTDLYRGRVHSGCGIAPDGVADALLVVRHGDSALQEPGQRPDTRRWYNETEAYLIRSLRERRFRTAWCGAPKCKPLEILTREMRGLTFCEQAALYARARVVVVHHGASLANSLFLRPSSVTVELSDQFTRNRAGESHLRWAHTFENAGYAALFVAAGLPYIGARVTYGVWPDDKRRVNHGRPDPLTGVVQWDPKRNPRYAYTDPQMEIAINRTRWAEVLDLLDLMVIGST